MRFERASFDLEIRQKPIRYQYVLCSHMYNLEKVNGPPGANRQYALAKPSMNTFVRRICGSPMMSRDKS